MLRALTLLALLAATAVAAPASAETRVELVTIEPGDAVWTRFGHVALRVVDPDRDLDVLFNYGYAPFDQPDFLWRYLRGEADFELAAKTWDWSLARYRRWDRTVRRREILMPPAMQHELLVRLQTNARPENAAYRYAHLRDNCSTRVRDLLDVVTGGAIREAAQRSDPGTTYRHYTLAAGSGRLLVQIIFDLIGGPNQEQSVDGWAELYLPGPLEAAAAAARIDWRGEERPLLGPPILEYERQAAPPTSGNLHAGRRFVAAAGIAIGLILLAAGRLGRRDQAWARALVRSSGVALLTVSIVFGLLGLALLVLVLVSRVPDFVWNENVLVFWPLDLIWLGAGVRWLLSGKVTVGPWIRGYTTARLLLLAAYAASKVFGWMPQDNWAFVGAASAVVVGLWLGIRRTEGQDD